MKRRAMDKAEGSQGVLPMVALVTGAARGIGRAIAERFASEGWRVAACDASAFRLPGSDEGVLCRRCDVSDEAAVRDFVQAAAEEFGGVHCVVNNAAISDPYLGCELEELDLEAWNRVLAVNLTGPMLLVKHALPHLRAAGSQASVVNIASTRARMSEPRSEAYAASKGGLCSLTHAMSVSLAASRIRANVVLPGWIATEEQREAEPPTSQDEAFHPCGRVGMSSDVAEMVLFLADPSRSGFVTGQEFVVDGGVTRKMVYPE